MNLIIQLIGLALFSLGLSRGAAWPRTRAATHLARVGLFWVSVAGLLGVLASAFAIFGIAAEFDERTDTMKGLDDLFTVARQLVIGCIAIAGAAHFFLPPESKRDVDHHHRA